MEPDIFQVVPQCIQYQAHQLTTKDDNKNYIEWSNDKYDESTICHTSCRSKVAF
jgi:hypothetical protein